MPSANKNDYYLSAHAQLCAKYFVAENMSKVVPKKFALHAVLLLEEFHMQCTIKIQRFATRRLRNKLMEKSGSNFKLKVTNRGIATCRMQGQFVCLEMIAT